MLRTGKRYETNVREMRSHERPLRARAEIGVLATRDEERRGTRDTDAIRPILAASIFEPCTPCVTIGAQDIGDRNCFELRVERRACISCDVRTGVGLLCCSIARKIGEHRSPLLIRHRLGTRRRSRNEYQAFESGEANAIFGTPSDDRRDFRAHTMSHDEPTMRRKRGNRALDVRDHFHDGVAARFARVTEARQIERNATRVVNEIDNPRPLARTSPEIVKAEDDGRLDFSAHRWLLPKNGPRTRNRTSALRSTMRSDGDFSPPNKKLLV